MGKHFGNLHFIRGVIYYKLSPYELKPFANFGASVANVITRTRATVFRWLPTFIGTYCIYRYTDYLHYLSKRKNPKDYENEVEPEPPKVCRNVEVVDKCGKVALKPEIVDDCVPEE